MTTAALQKALGAAAGLSADTPVAVDCSDLGKAFGGGGMEGMEWGCDGLPTLCVLAGEWHRAVVRVARLDRDVFGTGRGIDVDLAARKPCRCFLTRNSGKAREAFVRWGLGSLDIGASGARDATPDCRRVLVVESHLDGRSLYFYRTLGKGELAEERPPKARLRQLAVQTAPLYLQRLQIETSFLRVKQDFGLEDARVRTFKRLENLFALCYMAYLFVQFHLPGCGRYWKFMKVVKSKADPEKLLRALTFSPKMGLTNFGHTPLSRTRVTPRPWHRRGRWKCGDGSQA